MRHILKRVGAGAVACALAAGAAGCAETVATAGDDYPRMGMIANIKQKLLSKEEKDAAIRELSIEQTTHGKSAVREIERR